LAPQPLKWIIHLDLDSFYASAEVLDDPSLKGRPVIVGGLGPRGVISTASYEARAFGVRSGMPTAQAKKLCPQGVYLWGRMARYKELSQEVMDIFHRYTPLVEPLSLDEAFLDVTGSIALYGQAWEIASRVKREVRAETGLIISAGVATQKFIAKIASGLHKPDSLTVVPAGEELSFLWPLDLKELWGVGKVTLQKLRAYNLRTIGDLAKLPEGATRAKFGENGGRLWELANARDFREVVPEREAKSVGAEETYDVDIHGEETVSRELLALSVRVSERLRAAGLFGLTLTLKLRDSSFKTITRSKTLAYPLDDYKILHSLAKELIPPEAKGPFRLLGLQVSKLGPQKNKNYYGPPVERNSLFPEPERPAPDPSGKLAAAMDSINLKFGRDKVKPATLLDKPRRARPPDSKDG
jgi:DNA polymerase-4